MTGTIATMKLPLSRKSGVEREVTPLELFFDLVYVFAISQLSHHLYTNLNVRGGLQTAILALAVIYAWYMTTWGTNWLDPDRVEVKLFIVALMFCSLLMSVSIGGAFGPRAWLFVTAFLLMQVIRAVFMIAAMQRRDLSAHFVNDLVWELLAGIFWIVGAFVHGDARMVIWGLAVVVSELGVATLHWLPGRGRQIEIGQTEVAGEHLIERFRLFFLIALGETVVTTGTAFTERPFTVARLGVLAISFLGSVALWWCYFQRMEEIGVQATRDADDAGAAGHVGIAGTWALPIMVAALIAIAVADEVAITSPGASPSVGFIVLCFGGPLAFLLAQSVFLTLIHFELPRSRPLGIIALVCLALISIPFSHAVGIALATAVLLAVAVSDARLDSDELDTAAAVP